MYPMYSCTSQSAQTYALLAILLVAPRIVDSTVPVRVTFCCPSVVAPCIVDSIVPAWVTGSFVLVPGFATSIQFLAVDGFISRNVPLCGTFVFIGIGLARV